MIFFGSDPGSDFSESSGSGSYSGSGSFTVFKNNLDINFTFVGIVCIVSMLGHIFSLIFSDRIGNIRVYGTLFTSQPDLLSQGRACGPGG